MAKITKTADGWVISTSWTFHANGAAHSWRRRLAEWLRRQADRIDGRMSVSLHIESSPALSSTARDRAVEAGLRFMGKSLVEEVNAEALEIGLRLQQPHLFEERTS